ncbi:MAG TPA: diguanylate cyclase [Acidocella sp.]|jgi:diguanylate cyclase (GGDEF)-like protein/PAS domain S-box-containing protein|nr:diguanylate cyclase [Acidocella sp.]HQT39137.1 diguanylate cyclase [Acidocella sp.]
MIDLTNITFKSVVEAANDIVIVTDADLGPPGPRILYVNPAFTRLTGYTAEEAIGETPRILQGPGTCRLTLDRIRKNLEAGLDVRETILNFGKSGTRYWLDLCITPLRDTAKNIAAFIAIERDVTLNKHQLDTPSLTSQRDILTGIPNLLGLTSAIETSLKTKVAARTQPSHLAYIDIDNFRQIAEQYGDATSEAVLIGLSERLADNIRRVDSVGRISRDKFGICMGSISTANATIMCERLRNIIAEQPFPTPSGMLSITVSIGVTEIDADSKSASDIILRASDAKHVAKKAGDRRIGTSQRSSWP